MEYVETLKEYVSPYISTDSQRPLEGLLPC